MRTDSYVESLTRFPSPTTAPTRPYEAFVVDQALWAMTALSAALEVLRAPDVAACLSPLQQRVVERIEQGPTP